MEDEQIKDELLIPAFNFTIKQILDAWNVQANYGKFILVAYNSPSTSLPIDLTVPDHTIKVYYESYNPKYVYTVLTRVSAIFNNDHLLYHYAMAVRTLIWHATLTIPTPIKGNPKDYITFSPLFTVKELIEGEYEKWRESNNE